MSHVIEIEGLRKEFDGFALQNLSLAVEEGTITGLVGANGAGKHHPQADSESDPAGRRHDPGIRAG